MSGTGKCWCGKARSLLLLLMLCSAKLIRTLFGVEWLRAGDGSRSRWCCCPYDIRTTCSDCCGPRLLKPPLLVLHRWSCCWSSLFIVGGELRTESRPVANAAGGCTADDTVRDFENERMDRVPECPSRFAHVPQGKWEGALWTCSFAVHLAVKWALFVRFSLLHDRPHVRPIAATFVSLRQMIVVRYDTRLKII